MRIAKKYNQTSGQIGTILSEDIKQIWKERNNILLALGADPLTVDNVSIKEVIHNIEISIAKETTLINNEIYLTSHKLLGLDIGDSISFITPDDIEDVTEVFVDGQFAFRFSSPLKPLTFYELIKTDTGYSEKLFSSTSMVGLAYPIRKRYNKISLDKLQTLIAENDVSEEETDIIYRLNNDLENIRRDFDAIKEFIEKSEDIPYIGDILNYQSLIRDGLNRLSPEKITEIEESIVDLQAIIAEYQAVITEIGVYLQESIDACEEVKQKTIDLDNYVASKTIIQDADILVKRNKLDTSYENSTTFLETYNHMIVPDLFGVYPQKGTLIEDLDTFYAGPYTTFMERYRIFETRLDRFELQYDHDKLLLLPHIEKNATIPRLVEIGNYETGITEPLVSTTDDLLTLLETLRDGIESDNKILSTISVLDNSIGTTYVRFRSASNTLNALLDSVTSLVDRISDHRELRETIFRMHNDAKFINLNYNKEFIVVDYTPEEKVLIETALLFVQSDYRSEHLIMSRNDGLSQTIQSVIDDKILLMKDWKDKIDDVFIELDTRGASKQVPISKHMYPTQLHKDTKFPIEFVHISGNQWNLIKASGNKIIKFYDGALVYNRTSNTAFIYSSIFHDVSFRQVIMDDFCDPRNGDYCNFRNTMCFVTIIDGELVVQGMEYTSGFFRFDSMGIKFPTQATSIVSAYTRGNGIVIDTDIGTLLFDTDRQGEFEITSLSGKVNINNKSYNGESEFQSSATGVNYVDSKMVHQFTPLSSVVQEVPVFRHQDFISTDYISGQGVAIVKIGTKTYLTNTYSY